MRRNYVDGSQVDKQKICCFFRRTNNGNLLYRAKAEAEIISSSGHDVLMQFGGICSPEFSISKLFWLYRNDKPRFEAAQAFMELGDWLTYRSSHLFGTPQKFPRSLCCVVCKFGYDAENHKWRDDLFESLGNTELSLLHKTVLIYIMFSRDTIW